MTYMNCLRCNGTGGACCQYTGLQGGGYYEDLSAAIKAADERPGKWVGTAAVYMLDSKYAVITIGTPLFSVPRYGVRVY